MSNTNSNMMANRTSMIAVTNANGTTSTMMMIAIPATDDNQVRAAHVLRELYLATDRDEDALIMGISEALCGHDDDAACALEAAMFAVLRRRRPALVG